MRSNNRNLSTFLIIIYTTFSIHAQKKKIDVISVNFERELISKKIDTVLTAHYRFDNGRGFKETKLYFWSLDGKQFVKVIKNTDKGKTINFKIRKCPELTNILNFYLVNSKEILSPLPIPKTPPPSHNYGFYIKLKINETEIKTYLRDENRTNNSHCRSEWINMIAEVAKTSTVGK